MIRAAVARSLEQGSLSSPVTHALSRFWEWGAGGSRSVEVPGDTPVVGVGGSTLGGSYKTPMTLALAVALRERGKSVAVVAHDYGAKARYRDARRVEPHDTPQSVGDDALWLHRELSSRGVPVFVGERAAALRAAATAASVVVVDGLLQAKPRRLFLSLLCVDAGAPWGSGVCPPVGDLRASRKALLGAADAVVVVLAAGAHGVPAPSALHGDVSGRPVLAVETVLSASFHGTGAPVQLTELATARIGVVLAIARPERFVQSLAAHRLVPAASRLFADHAVPRPSRRSLERPVDVWLTTPKCATKLGAYFEGAPVVVLRQELSLPSALLGKFSQ